MYEWWIGQNIILSTMIIIRVEQLLFKLYSDIVYKYT